MSELSPKRGVLETVENQLKVVKLSARKVEKKRVAVWATLECMRDVAMV